MSEGDGGGSSVVYTQCVELLFDSVDGVSAMYVQNACLLYQKRPFCIFQNLINFSDFGMFCTFVCPSTTILGDDHENIKMSILK